MARKRTMADLLNLKGESTAELVDSFCLVSAGADAETKARAEEINSKWAGIHQRNMETMKKLAEERKIVRQARFGRTCFWLGVLERETPKFYVYQIISTGSPSRPPELLSGGERITKAKVHLEPCENCGDHPQSRSPGRTW